MILPELEAGDEKTREPVVVTLLHLQVEDGKGAEPEILGSGGLKPRQYLPLRDGEGCQLRDELRSPRAGAHDEAAGLVLASLGAHPHAATAGTPLQRRLPAMDFRAVGQRLLDVRDVASLRQEKAAFGLVQAANLLRQPIPGETPVQLCAVHDLVRQVVQLARPERPPENGAALWARIYASRDVEEPLACETLELAPQLVGTAEQRHIAWVLPVGEPDDSGEAVGR